MLNSAQKVVKRHCVPNMLSKVLVITLLLSAMAFGQAALMPIPRPQFFDASGRPLAGGFVYTYQAGTTTPLATYTDSSGTTQNSNPVLLDAGGFPTADGAPSSIWLGNVAYMICVSSYLGVQQYCTDNVTSSGSSGSSGAVQLNPTAHAAQTISGPLSLGTYEFFSQALSLGQIPAVSGALNMSNNTAIYERNVGNTGDIELIGLNSSNVVRLGDSAAPYITIVPEITVPSIFSQTANASTGNFLNLAKTDTLAWRNNANSANLPLGINGSDLLSYNGMLVWDSPAGLPSMSGQSGKIMSNDGTNATWVEPSAGTGNVASGNFEQLAYYASNGTTVSGTANILVNPSAASLSLGALSSVTGQFIISDAAGGQVKQTTASTTFLSTITWGNTSGTPAVTASAPLAINSTTGNITLTGMPGVICGATSTCSATSQALLPVIIGTVPLSGGTATVTALPAFSSISTFVCTANDSTAANAVKVANASSSSVTFTGTGTDVIAYRCTGY